MSPLAGLSSIAYGHDTCLVVLKLMNMSLEYKRLIQKAYTKGSYERLIRKAHTKGSYERLILNAHTKGSY